MTAAIYAVADVHLADGPSAFDAFLAWLAGRPPARLVILGDLFEYWLDTPAVRQAHAPRLAALRALSGAGWRLDLVPGNRELVAGRMLAGALRCRLHRPWMLAEAGGRRLRCCHGDRLLRDPGHLLYQAFLRGFWFRTWQACHPEAVQDLVARALRRSSRGYRATGQRRRLPVFDPGRLAAALSGADALLLGHLHLPFCGRLAGREVVVLGAWDAEDGSFAEVDAQGAIALRRWRGREPA